MRSATVVVTDPDTRRDFGEWMPARGRERRATIWFRNAEVAEAVQAILFIGLAPHSYPPNYDCGACGYATCARIPERHQRPPQGLGGAGVHRPDLLLAQHRPRYRRPIRGQNRHAALDRLPLPNPGRGSRAQARRHHRSHRGRPVAVRHAQGDRFRSADARGRLRLARPTGHRHAAHRNRRSRPRRRNPQPPATPTPHQALE
jgi:hypothetical protein